MSSATFRDVVIQDYLAGIRVNDIAAKRGLSRTTVLKRVSDAGLSGSRRPRHPKRPVRPCEACGTDTTALSGTCRPCRGLRAPEPAEEDGLGEGAWVLDAVRRIRVWCPADAVDGAYRMSAGLETMKAAKNRRPGPPTVGAVSTWSGSRRPHPAKNGSD